MKVSISITEQDKYKILLDDKDISEQVTLGILRFSQGWLTSLKLELNVDAVSIEGQIASVELDKLK